MKVVCLRDCYTGDRFYAKGSEHNFPDGTEVSPKNFQVIEGVAAPTVATPFFEPLKAVSVETTEDTKLDYANAPVYVSDKGKTKKKK